MWHRRESSAELILRGLIITLSHLDVEMNYQMKTTRTYDVVAALFQLAATDGSRTW